MPSESGQMSQLPINLSQDIEEKLRKLDEFAEGKEDEQLLEIRMH